MTLQEQLAQLEQAMRREVKDHRVLHTEPGILTKLSGWADTLRSIQQQMQAGEEETTKS